LEVRIARLERQNNGLRLAALASAVVVAVLLTSAAMRPEAASGTESEPVAEVRARAFSLVDDQGNERGRFEVAGGGGVVTFVLKDAAGKPRAKIDAGAGGAQLWLDGQSEKGEKGNSVLLHCSKAMSSLALYRDGNPSVSLTSHGEKDSLGSSLEFADSSGLGVMSLRVNSWSGSLGFDPRGGGGLKLGTWASGQASREDYIRLGNQASSDNQVNDAAANGQYGISIRAKRDFASVSLHEWRDAKESSTELGEDPYKRHPARATIDLWRTTPNVELTGADGKPLWSAH